MRVTSFWICLILAGPAVSAQSDADFSADLVHFDRITMSDGFPGPGVFDIHQDRFGYVWFATYYGLTRWDGDNFAAVRPSAVTSGCDSTPTALAEEDSLQLWVSFLDGSLCRVLQGTTEMIPVEPTADSAPVSSILKLYAAAEDTLVGSAPDGKLFRLATGVSDSVQITAIDSHLPSGYVVSLQQLSGDKLLAASNTFLASMVSPWSSLTILVSNPAGATHHDFDPLISATIPDMGFTQLAVSQNFVYLPKAADGVWRFDTRDATLEKIIPHDFFGEDIRLVEVVLSTSGILWIGTTDGVYRYDPISEMLSRLPLEMPDDLKPIFVVSMVEDRQGLLWIGTYDDVQFRIDTRTSNIGTLKKYDDLVGETFNPRILELSDGRILVPSESGIIQSTPGASSSPSLASWQIVPSIGPTEAIAIEPSGRLWRVAVEGGLSAYLPCGTDDLSWCLQASFQLPAERDPAWAVEVGPLGAIWVALGYSGLLRLDPETGDSIRFVHSPRDAKSLPNGYVDGLQIGHDGKLWINTWNADRSGLAVIDPATLELETFYRDGSTSLIEAFHLYQSPNDSTEIWLGTPFGLANLEPGSQELELFPVQKHGIQQGVSCVVGEANGFIWAAGFHSIVRFDTISKTYRLFGADRGVAEGALINGSGCLQTSSGWMIVLGNKTYVFHPDHLSTNENPAMLVLESVSITDRGSNGTAFEVAPVTLREEVVRLGRTQNDITFNYRAMHFGSPQRIRYRHKLEPYDRDWVAVGGLRSARYANLDPGEYSFTLQATNGYDIWGPPQTLLSFVIALPWWRTWWGLLLLIISPLMLLFTGYRLRIRALRSRAIDLESEVKLRTRELALEKELTERQAGHLEELNKAKDRLLTNLTHEFRTPLTLIDGPATDVLSGRFGEVSPEIEEQQHIIRSNARRLLSLVNQILDLARLRSPSTVIQSQDLDVVAACRELVQGFQPLAERRRLLLVFESNETCLPARLDGALIQKGLGNMISNAIKFSEPESEVHVTCDAISSGDGLPNQIFLRVADQGPGLDRETIEHIFDRFYQGDTTQSATGTGVGIGLALAKELTELHHGSITAENRTGGGSLFTIRIPHLHPASTLPHPDTSTPTAKTRAANEETTAPVPPAKEHTAPDRSTILIVEDNAEVRAYLRRHLEDYNVLEASNGEEGITLAIESRPDLVLSDVMMPVMDGFEMCRLLKANEALFDVPIVLLTAKVGVEATIEGLQSGADAYVTKPFDTEELRVRMSTLISSRQALKESYRSQARISLPEIDITSEDQLLLAAILEAIEENLEEPSRTVNRLSEAVGVGRRQLERRLDGLLHETPAGLIRRLRLERASQMLAKGSGTVGEVAYRVGFRSASHFSQAYKDRFGMPPKERRLSAEKQQTSRKSDS